MSDSLAIAVIGDVHGSWTSAERRWFDASSYDLVIFVGDLATFRDDGREVARDIARMTKPTLLMPGNHDGISLPHLAAETVGPRALLPLVALGQHQARRRFAAAAHPLALCGYCSHPWRTAWGEVTLIGARPHSNGGPALAFATLLERLYGVASLESSAARLRALVDDASEDIVFFGHNGPTGLGQQRHDLWGCDFKVQQGDFGDPDLRAAIDHARASGKRVRAVLAGHMHHRLKGGGRRTWCAKDGDTVCLNAARVPRIERPKTRPPPERGDATTRRHHHVALTLHANDVEAVARVVDLPAHDFDK